ncbi:ubx domain containing protein [Holotrichia oblita]|uniref:Ubx domain containing protein n=2 Tax=Holotrichia oblita TaxID=644536 RepID=A0ACB9TPK2_HOLOL|nr:ubx domain containing protein [Holotrichia oblita]KAI4468574.1 ubx domain containing protein [Holotrichia oblita]
MSDNNEKLQQFLTVTGIDEERARFYMESSAWDLELALTSFYDADSEQPEVVHVESPRSEPEDDATANNPAVKAKPKPRAKANSRFATLHTLETSSSDEEEGQAFYAGGSESSGQQVLGPSKKKKDIVSEMFKSVQEHGVEILDSATTSTARAFKGTGYKLGQTGNDSETIPGRTDPPPPAEVTMKLWRDGFSVNDGPLRAYTDPANRDFLDSVTRGEIPTELRQGVHEVHLSMEDHRMEEFKQDHLSRYTKPFSGQGHTLGSPTPATVGAPLEEDKNVNEAHARQMVNLDATLPTTSLQIRLADGSRLIGQFNRNHTVGQVRSFIIAARPQYETRPFALLSSYPSKELQDSQTIEDAGILNAAIMQKLK